MRGKFTLCLIMMGVFPFFFPVVIFGSSFCDSSGSCRTVNLYYYGGHYDVGEYPSCVSYGVDSCGFTTNDGCVDPSINNYRESYDVRVQFYNWNGSSWDLVSSSRFFFSVDTLQALIDQFDLGVSVGTSVNGTSLDSTGSCSPPPPPCDDSEKICACYEMHDQFGVLVAGSYTLPGGSCTGSTIDFVNPVYLNIDGSVLVPDNPSVATYVGGAGPCYCPSYTSGSELPQDFEQQTYVSQEASVPDAMSQHDCEIQCFPRGYIYADGVCFCVPEDSSVSPSSSPPESVTDSTPSSDPSDPSDDSGWLQGIKGDLDTRIDQANQNNQYLANIADNLATSVGNQGVIADAIGNNTAHVDSLGQKLSDIQDAIEDGNNQGYELQGSGELPEDNTYDSEVDEVEEDSLLDAVTSYISSGIPILSYIQGTSLQLNNASSSMQCDLWGHTVVFDLSSQEDILNTMGYILTGLSMVIAFFIIVRR